MLLNQDKEQLKSIRKDSAVEVSSEDEGFKGAWYRAILQENPTKSGRKKLQVRYTTLVDEDRSSLLTEVVGQRFIRPVPPEDLNEFEEGSVVDADLKDGWWTGVVIKKLEDEKFLVYFDSPPDVIQFEKKQLRTHLDWIGSKWVRPENKELSESLFRSGTFVEVSCKIDKLEAVWVPGLIVKEIEEDGEKKFIVKCCNKSLSFNGDEVKPNIVIDLCNVRPIPPPFFVKEYELLDRVDAFRGSGWRQGLVRGILSDKRYTVSFVATKDESVFKHSDLRPSKEWEDGVWHQGPKRNTDKNTRSDGKRKMSVAMDTTLSEFTALCRPKKLKIIHSSTAAKPITRASLSAGRNAAITPKRTTRHTKKSLNSAENTETANERETELREIVAAMELPLAPETGNQMADDVMNGDATPVITPQVIPIEKDSAPPVTPVISATLVKEPEAKTQGKASPEKTLQLIRMQNGLGIDSTGEKMSSEHNMREYSRKRKREQKHDSNLNDTSDDICDDDDDDQPLSAWIRGGKSSTGSDKSKLSPARTSNAVKTSADHGTRANEDTTMILPFVKHSPIWKVFETMEIFKTVKQTPHFIPLLETREEFREGSAVGEMVKYSGLIERVKNLQLHTPKSTLETLKECFSELEKYGFDVTTPISRIDMLIPLKEKRVDREEELKDKERQMAEEDIKRQKVEEDMREVERKILELQSREADLKVKKEASEKEIARMQLCASALDKNIQEVELEFQSIVSSPW